MLGVIFFCFCVEVFRVFWGFVVVLEIRGVVYVFRGVYSIFEVRCLCRGWVVVNTKMLDLSLLVEVV